MDDSRSLTAQWLTWDEAADGILALRRRVFMDEMSWPEKRIHRDRDPDGLHLCAVSGGEIVAAISAYVYEPGAPELDALELSRVEGPSVGIGMRVELPEYRGRLLTAEIGTSMLRQISESLLPSRFFVYVHADTLLHLVDRYARRNFSYHTQVGSGADTLVVMKVEGEEDLERFYLQHRDLTRKYSAAGGIPVPSLVRFLAENKRADLLAVTGLGAENHYLREVRLETEAPRLASQGQVMLAEQRRRLAMTPFPPAPASLLDIGSGPGDYLAAVAGEAPFAGYQVRGVEPAAELLTRARAAYPELDFREGSAYATDEPDSSRDVITASFVFIHLRSPDLALLEMRRILRPGGLLYVVDANDATFTGPEVVRRMVQAYNRVYAGDRLILNDLPERAQEFGFELVRQFSTTVRDGGGARPVFGEDEIRLGKADAWSLLSFVRTQPGCAEIFEEAQQHYFATECQISLNIETHVYRLRTDTA
ncbi:methyltransferase domain-containing protein [Nonomuraea bangladeshensis]|uniref:methyltransferase domain-containing protein n=1 Tax=Nonomuraea bangladeshensis TaxID=404385 RepID=UPI003C307836